MRTYSRLEPAQAMLSVFQFFRERAAAWRRENSTRTEDYILGGVVALREASEALAARKDTVDVDKLAGQLRAADKENREVQQRNAELNKRLRDMTTKLEKANVALGLAQVELAHRPAIQNEVPGLEAALAKGRKMADLLAEAGSLRRRISVLEQLLRDAGQSTADPGSVEGGRHGRALQLQKEMDELKGVARVGPHIASLPRLLKALRRVLKYEGELPEVKLAYVARAVANAEAVLAGHAPEDWLDKPDTITTLAA